MNKYTAELRALIANNVEIFDFDYIRSEDAKAILSDEDLEKSFIDRYALREIGHETIERWKHQLMVQWRESITNFDKLLVAYNQPINIKSNGSVNNTVRYSDTPQSRYDSTTDHITSITENNNQGYSGVTEIELLEIYHDKIKDITSEFLDSFDNLFMQIF